MNAGVLAPAVTPTFLIFINNSGESSLTVSILIVLQYSLQTRTNFCVFEEWRPPITIIKSFCFASSAASVCLSSVALHIVSKISQFVHSFFTRNVISSHFLSIYVVCATRFAFFVLLLAIFSHSSNSAGSLKVNTSPSV